MNLKMYFDMCHIPPSVYEYLNLTFNLFLKISLNHEDTPILYAIKMLHFQYLVMFIIPTLTTTRRVSAVSSYWSVICIH